jgi:hypothetical protein
VRIWLFPLIIISIAIAVLTAAHYGVHGFSIDPKVKPYEVLNLTFTILIAFFLQYYLAGRARDSRVEKDILISSVREVTQQLRNCRDTVTACQNGKPIAANTKKEILGFFRKLSNELLHVENVVEISNCKELTEKCRLLQNDLREYKMASTGGNFPGPYTNAAISDQEKAYRKLQRGLDSLVFEINKHP